MASHLDLEEQEKLDELRHFWKNYGNLISWVLIAVFGTIAAFNGWNWYQRNQAGKASALYDEVERAVQSGDVARAQQGFTDMREKFSRTVYAQQAGLVVAQAAYDKGQADAAKTALGWVASQASDEGLKTVARLRLAALLVEAKAYDEALKQLDGEVPAAFTALVADRRGDIYNLQGKKDQARAEYTKAWQGLDQRAEYRRLLEVKLTALGVDPKALAPADKADGAKARS